MHARAAEALLSAYAGREHQVAAVLGQHLAAAGQPDAATPWLLSAARQAASSYANEEAAALAATALDLFDERTFVDEAATARRTDLHVVRGRALHRLARYDAAAESLRAALAHISARDPLAVAELQLELAAVLRDAQLWEAALELLTAAETALGDLVKTPDGFDTWLKIQLDRCAVYYWYEAGGEHLGLLESVRADVEQRGTLDQQMDFYDSLRTAMWRRSGYAPWPGAMELDRLVYEHQRRDPDPLFRAWAEFSHGVGLLWAGEVDLAGRPLSIAAAEAERLEDAQLRSRALTYLMVVARQRRDVDGAMALVAQVDQAARDAGLQEYQALATATRAWAAYARGDLEGCLAQGRKALAQGDAAPMRYPFDWMSCLPLLAVALQRRDTPTALRLVGRMLDEHQQPLPADVARPLHAAVDATEPDAVAAALTEAVEAARANGRL
jgi:hypothetical protein